MKTLLLNHRVLVLQRIEGVNLSDWNHMLKECGLKESKKFKEVMEVERYLMEEQMEVIDNIRKIIKRGQKGLEK